MNTEETSTLKNKIKLMELENKLLKDNVTNKQRFIDIILHNTVRNSLETLMLVVLSMLQTRQGSNRLKCNISRKKIPSWITNKNKKINQVRKWKKMKATKKNQIIRKK